MADRYGKVEMEELVDDTIQQIFSDILRIEWFDEQDNDNLLSQALLYNRVIALPHRWKINNPDDPGVFYT
uniref:Uncharacterized protein n=1 Tax=Onchocerca volvulus TaxID=6282 RepID=A0A8R1TT86_ONCVO